MAPAEYAKIMIDHLYEEGERDLIFFSQLLDMVSYDFNDVSFGKKDGERVEHAIALASYLLSSACFEAGQTIRDAEGIIRYEVYSAGSNDFCEAVRSYFDHGGIADINLDYAIFLRKIVMGSMAPVLSSDITGLFS